MNISADGLTKAFIYRLNKYLMKRIDLEDITDRLGM